jgi:hypothetical protein
MSLGGVFVRRNLRLFLRHSNKDRRLQFMTTIAEWPHYGANEPFYIQTPACGGLKADSQDRRTSLNMESLVRCKD